jgi:hypothetical protein
MCRSLGCACVLQLVLCAPSCCVLRSVTFLKNGTNSEERIPACMEAVSSIRNLRTHHAVVTRDPRKSKIKSVTQNYVTFILKSVEQHIYTYLKCFVCEHLSEFIYCICHLYIVIVTAINVCKAVAM